MSHHHFPALALAAGFLLTGLTAAAAEPLAGTRWRDRVLLVLASRADDPRLEQQRLLFRHMGADARERDLKLIEVVGDTSEAQTLRKRFDLSAGGFKALLIGKDGGDKLRSDVPLDAAALFPVIDAMPMRQEEMRRRS